MIQRPGQLLAACFALLCVFTCLAPRADAIHIANGDVGVRTEAGKLQVFRYQLKEGVSELVMLDDIVVELFQGERMVYRTIGLASFQHVGAQASATYQGQGELADEVTVGVESLQAYGSCTITWTVDHKGPENAFTLVRMRMIPSDAKPPIDADEKTNERIDDADPVLRSIGSSHVVRHVRPGVDVPEGVPGDTPHRVVDAQVRTYDFRFGRLRVLTPWYDGDWAFRGNGKRALLIYVHDVKPNGRTQYTMLFDAREDNVDHLAHEISNVGVGVLPRRTNPDIHAARLAAVLHRRPVALDLRSDRTGNLFEPGEAVTFNTVVDDIRTDHAVHVAVRVLDYDGKVLGSLEQRANFDRTRRAILPLTVTPPGQGIYFVEATATLGEETFIDRATFAVLPKREAQGVAPDSPFAIAAMIARPEVFLDHFPLNTVAAMAERVGIRRLRTQAATISDVALAISAQQARQRTETLRAHGILMHSQVGSDDVLANKDDLEAVLKEHITKVGPDLYEVIEVGNELNYKMSATEYVNNILKPSTRAIRAAAPDARILSMGFGGVFVDWMREFREAGGYEHIDVLSVHPSGFPRSPEFWQGWRGWVARSMLLDALAEARKAGKDIWVTEAYAPTPPDRKQVDVRTSADYMVRTYALSIALGVKVVEWYQFQDGLWTGQRPNPHDVEYNFGIVYSDLTPKPAYVAYAAMTAQLEGAKAVGRLDLGADDLYGIRFERDGKFVDVLWSTREKHETDLPWYPIENYEKDSRKPGEPWETRWHEPVEVKLPARNELRAFDILGRPIETTIAYGKVRLSLTGSPIYVTGLRSLPLLDEVWKPIDGGP